MVEYYDRLSEVQQKLINALIGAEPEGWKTKFPRLSREDKVAIGEIVFHQGVKNVRITFGEPSPLIHAEPS